jgi:drug/metabolite transporter (DMT)-like permease
VVLAATGMGDFSEQVVDRRMSVTMVLALASILASTVAQAMLKHGMDKVGGIAKPGDQFLASIQKVATEPFILGGLGLIIIALPMWLQVLARLPLSVAYPLVSLGYIISLGIGALVLKETITPLRVVGVAVIILGVIAVSKSQ